MVEINNRTKTRVDLKLIEKIVNDFLAEYKKEKLDVSIAIVGDTTIRELNKKYRKKDKVTDVLSFPEENDNVFIDHHNLLGEVVINIAQIKRQAKKYSKNQEEELKYILLHGLLHLLGYSDEKEEDRKKMFKIADRLMKK